MLDLAAEYAGYSYTGRWDMGNKERSRATD